MNSRTALRGSFVSKQMVAIAMVIAAIVLGVAAAITVRQLAPAASSATGYDAVTFSAGPAWDDSNRHHGTQSVGGSLLSTSGFREPSDQRGGPRD